MADWLDEPAAAAVTKVKVAYGSKAAPRPTPVVPLAAKSTNVVSITTTAAAVEPTSAASAVKSASKSAGVGPKKPNKLTASVPVPSRSDNWDDVESNPRTATALPAASTMVSAATSKVKGKKTVNAEPVLTGDDGKPCAATRASAESLIARDRGSIRSTSSATTAANSTAISVAAAGLTAPLTSVRQKVEFDDEALTPTSGRTKPRTNHMQLDGAHDSSSISWGKDGKKKRPLLKARIAQGMQLRTNTAAAVVPATATSNTMTLGKASNAAAAQASAEESAAKAAANAPTASIHVPAVALPRRPASMPSTAGSKTTDASAAAVASLMSQAGHSSDTRLATAAAPSLVSRPNGSTAVNQVLVIGDGGDASDGRATTSSSSSLTRKASSSTAASKSSSSSSWERLINMTSTSSPVSFSNCGREAGSTISAPRANVSEAAIESSSPAAGASTSASRSPASVATERVDDDSDDDDIPLTGCCPMDAPSKAGAAAAMQDNFRRVSMAPAVMLAAGGAGGVAGRASFMPGRMSIAPGVVFGRQSIMPRPQSVMPPGGRGLAAGVGTITARGRAGGVPPPRPSFAADTMVMDEGRSARSNGSTIASRRTTGIVKPPMLPLSSSPPSARSVDSVSGRASSGAQYPRIESVREDEEGEDDDADEADSAAAGEHASGLQLPLSTATTPRDTRDVGIIPPSLMVDDDTELDQSIDNAVEASVVPASYNPTELGLSNALAGILEFLPSSDLLHRIPAVCTAWAAQATHVYSWRVATSMSADRYAKARKGRKGKGRFKKQQQAVTDPSIDDGSRPLTSWLPFLHSFPWGAFLSEGAYKSVYRVWNASRVRMEAVSVMDVAAIASTGNLAIIQAEIQAGCLLSHLVRTGVCPNFVRTHQVFVSAYTPKQHFPALWGCPVDDDGEQTSSKPKPKRTCPFDPTIPSPAAAQASIKSAAVVPTRRGKPSAAPPAGLPSPALSRAKEAVAQLSQLPSSAPIDPPPSEHQYIRMELCGGGDVEDMLRKMEQVVTTAEAAAVTVKGDDGAVDGIADAVRNMSLDSKAKTAKSRAASKGRKTAAASPPNASTAVTAPQSAPTAVDLIAAQAARSMAFQMVFSLFASRERLSFRHFDVKLLNFFAKPAADEVAEVQPSPAQLPASVRTLRLLYAFGTEVFDVDLNAAVPASSPSGPEASLRPSHIIKLADYGTASTLASTLTDPMQQYHFTTLENAPPEYFILGDEARQDYGSDTWGLGLCMVHLLTGACPYEEVMADIKCPAPLRDSLVNVWTTAPGYGILAYLLQSDDSCAEILADTLYRFAVLTGLPASVAYSADNKVWQLLLACCGGDDASAPTKAPARGRAAAAASQKGPLPQSLAAGMPLASVSAARKQFVADSAACSLATGSHPLLVRARRRLAHLPGFLDLTRRVLAWQPTNRICMRDALLHPAFVPLRRINADLDDEESDADAGVMTLTYPFYGRDEEAEVSLPAV